MPSTNSLKSEIKYLGVDWGDKRIGLALGDSETNMSTPYKVVNNFSELLSIIELEKIDKIVLGQPKKRNDDNTFDNNFLDFKIKLESSSKVPVEIFDERLTSKAADALVGTKKTKAARDAIAAMIILQNYLDSRL